MVLWDDVARQNGRHQDCRLCYATDVQTEQKTEKLIEAFEGKKGGEVRIGEYPALVIHDAISEECARG
jgi:hypothetical protein